MIPDPLRSAEPAGAAPSRAMTREEIFGLVHEKLEKVGNTFSTGLGSNVDIVSAMGEYISRSGGKRLRPALLLLASGACGYEGSHDVLFGSVFEFIHTATLIHDDIIDTASKRRGRESVNHRWGNHLTVLMGDHLYIKAMQLAIRAGNIRILELLAEITLRMIEGELMQGDRNGSIDMREEEHLEIVERKTATLFSGCCRVPAILARVPDAEERALASYGLDLGMAFQLVDDLLDLTADEETLGKPTSNDLREGKLTLPLIHLVRKGNPRQIELVHSVVADRGFSRVSREEILDALREGGCLDEARAAARRYAARAKHNIARLVDSPFKDALLAVPDFVLDRDR